MGKQRLRRPLPQQAAALNCSVCGRMRQYPHMTFDNTCTLFPHQPTQRREHPPSAGAMLTVGWSATTETQTCTSGSATQPMHLCKKYYDKYNETQDSGAHLLPTNDASTGNVRESNVTVWFAASGRAQGRSPEDNDQAKLPLPYNISSPSHTLHQTKNSTPAHSAIPIPTTPFRPHPRPATSARESSSIWPSSC